MRKPAGKRGMATRKEFISFWLVSKTIKWSTPIGYEFERLGEKINKICCIRNDAGAIVKHVNV